VDAQLFNDLAVLKARLLSEFWGKHSYCYCLAGHAAQVTGVEVLTPDELGPENDRFRAVIAALADRLPGFVVSTLATVTTWNDAPLREHADAIALVQDAANFVATEGRA
jgi:hypothetical protein